VAGCQKGSSFFHKIRVVKIPNIDKPNRTLIAFLANAFKATHCEYAASQRQYLLDFVDAPNQALFTKKISMAALSAKTASARS
jgi:hypothetical protein